MFFFNDYNYKIYPSKVKNEEKEEKRRKRRKKKKKSFL